MSEQKFAKEVPGLVLTAARYLMAERIARRVRRDKSIAADLVVFIGADILDGVILRAINADTPARRAADGIVDNLSMARVAYEALGKHPSSRVYLGAIAARGALVGGLNALHYIKTGEVTKGGDTQRLAHLATAAFGLVAMTGSKRATHTTGALAATINIATVIPHARGIGELHANGIRNI